MAKLTKNQKIAHAKLEAGKSYSLKDAAALAQNRAIAPAFPGHPRI